MKGYRKTALASLLCLIAAALSLSTIPLIQVDKHGPGMYIAAGVFWGGMLLGLAFFVLASVKFRKHRATAYERKLVRRQPLPGALTFRLRADRLALDGIIAAGLVRIGTVLRFHWAPDYLMFPILSTTMIAFALHCFLDGRNHQVYEKLKEGMKNGSK